jgi:hypothetical protein
MTKKLLIIAAVAVMLAGATSAYAYHEKWDGWFNSGYLILTINNHEYTFNYTSGSGVLEDRTYGSVDSFFVSAINFAITFTCESGPYEGYYIKLWPGASGWKLTGESGQKEVYDGEWSGFAILYRPGQPNKVFNPVVGTWDTRDDGDYFDYTDYPDEDATYSAKWDVSYSTPLGLDGDGGSAGARIYPEE